MSEDDKTKQDQEVSYNVIGIDGKPKMAPKTAGRSRSVKRARSATTERSDKLTDKQERFANNVAREHMTYTDAYLNAYDTKLSNSPKDRQQAGQSGSKLVRHPKIARRIEEIEAEVRGENSAHLTSRADRVARKLEHIMEHGKTESVQLRAAELLGKSVAMFTDVTANGDKTPSTADLERKLEDLLKKARKA